jgi:hypothetical protein
MGDSFLHSSFVRWKNKSPFRKGARNVKAANGVCSKGGLANTRRQERKIMRWLRKGELKESDSKKKKEAGYHRLL